jgi:polyhydroxyalkanoate synthase subunit PhaC
MLAEDLAAGGGDLRLRQTDTSHFKVGVDLATTPGKVIARSDVAEIIQYEPSTPDVLRRPLLICPPWINKFYILDLTAEKSFIKWCVDNGQTVFVISWVNPDERHATKDWTAYTREGVQFALDCIEAETGEKGVNAIGYCVCTRRRKAHQISDAFHNAG